MNKVIGVILNFLISFTTSPGYVTRFIYIMLLLITASYYKDNFQHLGGGATLKYKLTVKLIPLTCIRVVLYFNFWQAYITTFKKFALEFYSPVYTRCVTFTLT